MGPSRGEEGRSEASVGVDNRLAIAFVFRIIPLPHLLSLSFAITSLRNRGFVSNLARVIRGLKSSEIDVN